MKRFHYSGNEFIDEHHRVWILSYHSGCPHWTLTDDIAQIPKDFEYIEFVPRYSI